jgi:CheY-like chemotaxis protein
MNLKIFIKGEIKMKRIMIVDDEKEITDSLCNLFKHNGFDAVGFDEADEALAHVKDNDIDIACLDIVMPVPDCWDAEIVDNGKTTGVELARQIKKIKPEIPLMSYTIVGGNLSVHEQIIKEIKKTGIKVRISKPARFADLLNAANQLLGI